MWKALSILLTVVIASISKADEVSKVSLKLGPVIPVVKGDDAPTEGLVIIKRDISSSFVSMKNNLKGYPGQGYSFELGLGTPPQNLSVLIDTGSANFAVAGAYVEGLKTYFTRSSSTSYESLGRNVYVPYTIGSWSGPLGSDIVHIGFLPRDKQNFRADVTTITKSSEFFIPGATWQGIVGLAFEEIARPVGDPAVTFLRSLVKETGTKNIFSTQLCGSSKVILKRKEMLQSGRLMAAIASADDRLRVKTFGSFVLGGIDKSLFIEPLLYTPLRKKWYYEVVITGMSVNSQEVMTDCKEYNFDKTIVDTGTTDIRLPKRVFTSLTSLLLKSVQGTSAASVVDTGFFQGIRMICLEVGSMDLFDSFPAIKFDLALDEYRVIHMSLSSQQYLRYVGYNSGLERDCFKFGVIESKMSSVLGAVFLEGFYTVFDRKNLRVGFAQSTCNYYGANVANSSVSGPRKFVGSGTTMDCAYYQAASRNLALIEAISIALGILCLLIFVPIIILLYRVTRHSQSGERGQGSEPNSVLRNDRSQLLKK